MCSLLSSRARAPGRSVTGRAGGGATRSTTPTAPRAGVECLQVAAVVDHSIGGGEALLPGGLAADAGPRVGLVHAAELDQSRRPPPRPARRPRCGPAVPRAGSRSAAGCRARRCCRCPAAPRAAGSSPCPTAGWTMLLSASSASVSLNTNRATAGRSRSPSAREHLRPEPCGELGEQGRATLLHLADDGVGVDDHRAPRREHRRDRRLARTDAPGESHQLHVADDNNMGRAPHVRRWFVRPLSSADQGEVR